MKYRYQKAVNLLNNYTTAVDNRYELITST